MSWIQNLYETYENCKSVAGLTNDEDKVPLLPICHTTQKAQIEIVIDSEGNFKRARAIEQNDATTIIPCTEESGGRTSGEAPHPLCDKLQYVAKDYKIYGGNKKHYFENYHKELRKWCGSVFKNPKVKSVLRYVEKGNVIQDLVRHKILHLNENGLLMNEWDKQKETQMPLIFKVISNSSQSDAFVRWMVEIPSDPQAAVWTDKSIHESWINYYRTLKQKRELCYVKGIDTFMADQHPAKIRNAGDKAKIISSNDKDGFTFRGRFLTSEQCCGVGFDVTQKAHNALKWLISKQGYRNDTQAIVSWAISGKTIPDPFADTLALIGFENINSDNDVPVFTAQNFAQKLNKKISGYRSDISDTENIIVMGLDSATPGRMSITFYRELKGSDFLSRIDNWHRTCSWIHDYRFTESENTREGKKARKSLRFLGAPSPKDIAEAIYGKRNDVLIKATVERILPCIIDQRILPSDLVESAVRRASNRFGISFWEWNKALSIACALYKKLHEEEELTVALDENRKTRDYLYGRLLALAESLEQWALSEGEKDRQTTAARLMQRFADHPYTTWRNIELALAPYKARLGGKSIKRQYMISQVVAAFDPEDFTNDKKLSGEFLLGYHSQREAFRRQKDDVTESD